MDKLIQLFGDISKLWEKYSGAYITGMQNTLILAVVATLIGCIIGFFCGVLNTIPYSQNDPLIKRVLVKLMRIIVRVYVEVFRGTPMVLQAVFIFYGLPYFTNNAVQFKGNEGIWVAALLVVSINTGAYMAESSPPMRSQAVWMRKRCRESLGIPMQVLHLTPTPMSQRICNREPRI